jgi:hypothetical protein
MQRIFASLVASAAAAGVAATPAQAAWPARTVATGGPAFSLDVAGLPGGGVATLLERRRSVTVHALELRVGSRVTELARAPHTFGPAEVGVDARGRTTVAYAVIPTARGGRRLYVTSGGRTVRLSSGPSTVNLADLDVAPDGSAVLAWTAGGRTFAARRAPGADAFGAPQDVTPPGSAYGTPRAEALGGGGAVVLAGAAVSRAPDAASPFGAPAVLLSGIATDGEQLAVDAGGRAVVALRTVEQVGPRGPYRRAIRVFTWDREAGEPSPAVALSTPAEQVGTPVAVANGARVTVAFKRAAGSRRPASLRAVVFAADGSRRVTERSGAGGLFGLLTATPSGTGVRVYARTAEAMRSVHLGAGGRPGGWSAVTSDAGVFSIDAAEAGRPVAVWTAQTRTRDNASWRVRIARPGR